MAGGIAIVASITNVVYIKGGPFIFNLTYFKLILTSFSLLKYLMLDKYKYNVFKLTINKYTVPPR